MRDLHWVLCLTGNKLFQIRYLLAIIVLILSPQISLRSAGVSSILLLRATGIRWRSLTRVFTSWCRILPSVWLMLIRLTFLASFLTWNSLITFRVQFLLLWMLRRRFIFLLDSRRHLLLGLILRGVIRLVLLASGFATSSWGITLDTSSSWCACLLFFLGGTWCSNWSYSSQVTTCCGTLCVAFTFIFTSATSCIIILLLLNICWWLLLCALFFWSSTWCFRLLELSTCSSRILLGPLLILDPSADSPTRCIPGTCLASIPATSFFTGCSFVSSRTTGSCLFLSSLSTRFLILFVFHIGIFISILACLIAILRCSWVLLLCFWALICTTLLTLFEVFLALFIEFTYERFIVIFLILVLKKRIKIRESPNDLSIGD